MGNSATGSCQDIDVEQRRAPSERYKTRTRTEKLRRQSQAAGRFVLVFHREARDPES